jgi:hypothetical protein
MFEQNRVLHQEDRPVIHSQQLCTFPNVESIGTETLQLLVLPGFRLGLRCRLCRRRIHGLGRLAHWRDRAVRIDGRVHDAADTFVLLAVLEELFPVLDAGELLLGEATKVVGGVLLETPGTVCTRGVLASAMIRQGRWG